jgi:hypothetical protein
VESNRLVCIEQGAWTRAGRLDIPAEGRRVWLRGFGEVKLFRTWLKDQPRHCVVSFPDANAYDAAHFERLRGYHWRIEPYHRRIRQVCNIEKFQVRTKPPDLHPILAALCGYVHLQQMRFGDFIGNAYRWRRDLCNEVVAAFIGGFMADNSPLNP